MKLPNRHLDRVATGSVAAALAFAVAAAPLDPPANEAQAMTLSAKGVQLYECRTKQGGGFEWAFVAPDADLIDAGGRSIGTHGAGPYWQASDGSKVVGTVKQRADAPVAGAIPWLLLEARSTGPAGAFGRVTSIQRVNTAGGLAPASGCGRDAIGKRVRSAYAADYVFFVPAADIVADWNRRTSDFIAEAKLGTPPAVRVMAIVQTAVYGAVSTIDTAQGATVEAAVATATRATLLKLVPAQQEAILAAEKAALARVGDGRQKVAGIAAGEEAAAAVLAARADDGATAPESYRPATAPGTYVPTATPAASQWPQRKPWLMATAAQFRPGPPPALTSDIWIRDYNEVMVIGAKSNVRRSPEATDIARFWEYSLPSIYYGVVRSVAQMPGRGVAQNALLYAAVAQAMDDAMIGVFDAKYHYNFWRPATAIRNGDTDGNEATSRDAAWVPFVDTPMHPEYPSAHSILASAVAAVLKAEIGNGATPLLTTTSPTAKGATRRWTSVDDFAREVGDARIFAGIHYRTSTDVGAEMGKQIGELTVRKFLEDSARGKHPSVARLQP